MPDPRDRDEAPEMYNAEQDDKAAQAQTVADAARHGGEPKLGDSEKVPTGTLANDAPDLIDHLHQMETSGLIDMSAFAGERNNDDEEGSYGRAAEEE